MGQNLNLSRSRCRIISSLLLQYEVHRGGCQVKQIAYFSSDFLLFTKNLHTQTSTYLDCHSSLELERHREQRSTDVWRKHLKPVAIPSGPSLSQRTSSQRDLWKNNTTTSKKKKKAGITTLSFCLWLECLSNLKGFSPNWSSWDTRLEDKTLKHNLSNVIYAG